MSMAVHFSAKRDDWRTPRDLFDRLNAQYGVFDLDAAANQENHLYYKWLGPGGLCENALAVSWEKHGSRVFCNPPYGRVIGKFIARAALAAEHDALVVMLLPARTDTAWFHTYCLPHGKIEFLRGRLKFDGQANSAPFPSMIVVFGGK